MDYHLAEVAVTGVRTLRDVRRFQARCACTWSGPVRDRASAAEDDATAHDIAENPITPASETAY